MFDISMIYNRTIRCTARKMYIYCFDFIYPLNSLYIVFVEFSKYLAGIVARYYVSEFCFQKKRIACMYINISLVKDNGVIRSNQRDRRCNLHSITHVIIGPLECTSCFFQATRIFYRCKSHRAPIRMSSSISD